MYIYISKSSNEYTYVCTSKDIIRMGQLKFDFVPKWPTRDLNDNTINTIKLEFCLLMMIRWSRILTDVQMGSYGLYINYLRLIWFVWQKRWFRRTRCYMWVFWATLQILLVHWNKFVHGYIPENENYLCQVEN